MKNIITMENFSENNRDKNIGNSRYRICQNDRGLWYIHEAYGNKSTGEWGQARGFYNPDLSEVIKTINRFTQEREVLRTQMA